MKTFFSTIENNLSGFNELLYVIDIKEETINWIGDINDIVKNSKLKSPTSLKKFSTLFNKADAKKFLQTPSLNVKKTLRNLKFEKDDLLIKDEALLYKNKKETYIVGSLRKLQHDITQDLTPEFEQFNPLFYLHIKKIFENKTTTNLVLRINITNLILISHLYSKSLITDIVENFQTSLNSILPENALVFKTSIDTISVVIEDFKKNEDAVKQLTKDIYNLSSQFTFPSTERFLHLNMVIGHIFLPEKYNDVQQAINNLYLTCQKSFVIKPQNSVVSDTNQFIQREKEDLDNLYILERAFFDKKLSLAYQPLVSTRTGKISHHEALLRYKEGGIIKSAGVLIPSAEKFGRINKIDIYVLERVLEELNIEDSTNLSFNISNVTTDDPDWIKIIQKHLNRNHQLASKLIIEITETAAQRDLRQTAYFVASMQALGCKVALDDFGTGYTSFHQLKYLSINMIKIDGIYVRNLKENSENYLFIKTLLDFNKSYGLETTAEFVESGDVAKILINLGVDYLQGYFFGKPEASRAAAANIF